MTRRHTCLAIAVLAALAGLPCRPALAQGRFGEIEPVVIVLPAEAMVDDTVITLGQVAKLHGGPPALRQRLARLDVAEFKLDAAHAYITRAQVQFRILLTGISPGDFQLEGAARTVVIESDQPATARKIVAAAEKALLARFPEAGSQVSLSAHGGIEVPAVLLRPGEIVRCEAKIKTPLPRAGVTMVEVALTVHGKAREVVPVAFDIVPLEIPAPKATKNSGGVRTAVYTTPLLDGKDVIIKARDSVKIIAHIGTGHIEAVGEAQQDGYVGQVIRVRNVDSNRVVHGRVDASGTVVVEY
jgi:hypothetical protein